MLALMLEFTQRTIVQEELKMSTQQELDPSILDISIDDIEDLPGFNVPSNGEYICKLEAMQKEVNEKSCVEFAFEVVQCLKKDKDSDDDAKEGDRFSILFMLEGTMEAVKISKGKLKEALLNVADSTGQRNIGVLVRDYIAHTVVQLTVKKRQDRTDKDRYYASIKNLKLA